MTRNLRPPALAALAILMLPQAALAEELTFCAGNKCGTVEIFNRASVTVTKIKMKQRAGSNNCPAVTKTRRKDVMTGSGETIDAFVNKNCPYTVKFKTSESCKGDKKGEVSINDLQGKGLEKVSVELEGGCGTLKTNVKRVKFRAGE